MTDDAAKPDPVIWLSFSLVKALTICLTTDRSLTGEFERLADIIASMRDDEVVAGNETGMEALQAQLRTIYIAAEALIEKLQPQDIGPTRRLAIDLSVEGKTVTVNTRLEEIAPRQSEAQ
jgi:hypothetical protein